ncbi:MAG: hypothetical protein LBU11_13150 [Zoogloeaceae bacterium]|nr:hypothetical protein [Zoogloeaceae bacterium]
MLKHLGISPGHIPPPYSGKLVLERSLHNELEFQLGRKDPEEAELAGTMEEVDWRAAEILEFVLPLMDQLRTVGGVDDFYYNEKAMEKMLNERLVKDSFAWENAIFSTIDHKTNSGLKPRPSGRCEGETPA